MTSPILQCVCLKARGSAAAVTTLRHTALHPFILHSSDQCEIRGQSTSSAACPCVSVSEGVSSAFPLACNWLRLKAKSLVITVCSRILSGYRARKERSALPIDQHVRLNVNLQISYDQTLRWRYPPCDNIR